MKNEEFDFGSMIEQINTMTESQCEGKGLDFDCNVRGAVDNFYVGDDMKLKQALINILGNAIKYTPAPGRGYITVEETKKSKEKATLTFTVKDTGVGMDAAYLPRLFEPFSQEQEGTSNRYGSTGLGMAISKNIIDMMCGTIQVSSEKGKGSEFVITIPLGVSGKTKASSEFDPTSIKTLIVDDDITACEHAKMVLHQIGVDAQFCQSGKEALVTLEQQRALNDPYRLLLVDWKMPEMDGVELTANIRKRYGTDDVTIILTTYNWDDIMEDALDAGVDAFLAKPLFAKSIRQEIIPLLSDPSAGRKRPAPKADLRGKKILLAEDMEINAQIMKQVLKMKEVTADLAKNGEDAVKLFENSKPALLRVIAKVLS